MLNSSFSMDGQWFPGSMKGNISTAVDTRSLSVNSISSFLPNTTTNLALLYYENPNGKLSALLQRQDIEQVRWIDITSQASESESEANITFSTPFTSGTNFSSSPGIGALFYTPDTQLLNGGPPDSGGSVLQTSFSIGPSGPGNFSIIYDGSDSLNQTSIRHSDIAMLGSYYAIWINGTKPVLYNSDTAALDTVLPDNAFPFARLASVTLADESATFLYHQIDGTTFAEEQWDDSLSAWIPTEYITVSGS